MNRASGLGFVGTKLCPALILSACAVSLANAAGAAATADKPVVLEEIVVTAQRREETVQKTPLAITALTSETLDNRGITNAAGLNQLVPGLAVVDNAKGAQLSMRGVVSTNDNELGDPAVAFNIDGVYMARSRGAMGAMYDVQRVEVLRGPQGTLYGRNATAGSINVITNKPDTSKDAFSASVSYGNYSDLQVFGMGNWAASDTFALRGAFQTHRHDGYSQNAPAKPYQDLDSVAGRVSALWKPSEQLTGTLILEYYHNGGAGGGAFGGAAPVGLYAINTGATPYNYAIYASPAPNGGSDGDSDQKVKGATLLVDWTLPFATLSYVGNTRTDDWHNHAGTAVTGAGTGCASITDVACASSTYHSYQSQNSHELRLANSGDHLKWVAGLYSIKEKNDVLLAFYPTFQPTRGARVFSFPYVRGDAQAVFGQATYSMTDRLRLTAGARYTEDSKQRTGTSGNYLGATVVGDACVGCTITAANLNNGDESWSKTTWKTGLEYDVSADSLLFASVGTGYKSGGFSDGAAPNNGPYDAENILAYELGIKNSLLDHRLQVNIDSFYNRYSNYQVSSLALTPDGGTTAAIVNAGKADIYGVEVETQALLSDVDRVNLSVSWLHAKFTDFNLPNGDQFTICRQRTNPFNPNSACVAGRQDPANYTGNRLPNSPDFTVNLGYEHSFDMTGGASLIPRFDFTYVTDQDLDYHNFAVSKQPSYTKTDLSLSYAAAHNWRVMAYVHNLEDKAVMTSALPDPRAPAIGSLSGIEVGKQAGTATYLPPRTYGVKFSVNY